MARQFDSRDAKRLITKHRELLEELRRAEKTFNGLRAAVKETTDALVAQEVMRVLKDIPVEELNRDRRGFRVKSLRDNGYQSIADIMGASVHSFGVWTSVLAAETMALAVTIIFLIKEKKKYRY